MNSLSELAFFQSKLMVQQMKLSSISSDTKTLTPASVRVSEFKFRHDLDALSINED